MSGPTPVPFWDRVDKHGPIPPHRPDLGPCWLWTGGHNRDGYGSVRVNARTVGVHQVAFADAGGVVGEGQEICHHCDVRDCVRPSHLFAATHPENVRDMHEKGRARKATGDANGSRKYPERRPRGDRSWAHQHPELMPRGDRNGARTKPESRARGERSGSARLTQAQVVDIRARFIGRRGQIAAFARELGVSKTTIRNVLLGRTWRAA